MILEYLNFDKQQQQGKTDVMCFSPSFCISESNSLSSM